MVPINELCKQKHKFLFLSTIRSDLSTQVLTHPQHHYKCVSPPKGKYLEVEINNFLKEPLLWNHGSFLNGKLWSFCMILCLVQMSLLFFQLNVLQFHGWRKFCKNNYRMRNIFGDLYLLLHCRGGSFLFGVRQLRESCTCFSTSSN